MTESNKEADTNKLLFLNLVMMFGTSAMQQLGKLVNPMTNKTEVDLRGAQASIDLLVMLEAKTKGNLDGDESAMLKRTLSSLQLNYVETAANAPAQTPDETPTDAGEKGPGPAADEAAKPAGKDPKYHKTYE